MFLIHTYRLHLTNPLLLLWILFWEKIPDRSKRMFVLASLYGQLTRSDGCDTRMVDAVNRRMDLSCSGRALQFPIATSAWIWDNILPLTKTNLDNKEHYIARLVKRTPCWLLYADAETRHNDISNLVEWTETHA
jgi:hypothetical protein